MKTDSIVSLQQRIEESIASFSAILPAGPEKLYEPIRYTLGKGGKRMRPLLVLTGCKIFHDDITQALPAAMGIELFHNFTLLHDDIMDNAPLRRGQATVHAQWNPNVAILSGDAMMVEAYKQMAQSPAAVMPRVLELFSKTALEVCEGQQLDMDFETQANVSIDQYLRMIELKTAVLLAASLKTGAICGGAPEPEAQKLYEFGRHIGIAFQLHDDILDVYSAAEKFGKQAGGDIISNKKTFLLLKAYELADRYRKEELHQWMHAPQFVPEEKVQAVKAIFDFLGVKKYAEDEMSRHYQAASSELNNVTGNENWKNILRDFCAALMVREH
ncbi:MAG: geranylgeranyl pyrophosphate synthase [Bacteroidetes bacterium]|nr:MAG: geranylgeranyl pyrophosphate synthase [Bacteroidota bacterium]